MLLIVVSVLRFVRFFDKCGVIFGTCILAHVEYAHMLFQFNTMRSARFLMFLFANDKNIRTIFRKARFGILVCCVVWSLRCFRKRSKVLLNTTCKCTLTWGTLRVPQSTCFCRVWKSLDFRVYTNFLTELKCFTCEVVILSLPITIAFPIEAINTTNFLLF